MIARTYLFWYQTLRPRSSVSMMPWDMAAWTCPRHHNEHTCCPARWEQALSQLGTSKDVPQAVSIAPWQPSDTAPDLKAKIGPATPISQPRTQEESNSRTSEQEVIGPASINPSLQLFTFYTRETFGADSKPAGKDSSWRGICFRSFWLGSMTGSADSIAYCATAN